MNKRIMVLGVPIDTFTMQETIDFIEQSIAAMTPLHHVVVNAAKLVNAQKDRDLKESIVHCDIINPDGQSVVWAARLLKQPLKERVAGIDLMINLINLAGKKGYSVFFLGAKEEIVSEVVEIYKNVFGVRIIAGYRNGYFTKEEEPEVAKQIAESGAHMLFVAITSPKKEIFLNKYKDIIKIPFIMGVGGSFDVVAGKTKRAPLWMQKAGMEWFYRVIQEPGRMWKRYLIGNSKFIYLVFREKLMGKS